MKILVQKHFDPKYFGTWRVSTVTLSI